MALEGEKSALGSIGVWGSLLSLLPAVLDAVNHGAATGALGPQGALIAAAVGGLVSLIGRLRAKKEITSVLPKS